MRKASASDEVLARRVWGSLFGLLMRSAPERTAALARRGLTPNDARALATLDSVGGRTMRSLAEEWGCDASNATWIVDRLEALGLARRRADARDGRVKLVVLTAKGERTGRELRGEFQSPPSELLALSRSELEALERAVRPLTVNDAVAPVVRGRGRS